MRKKSIFYTLFAMFLIAGCNSSCKQGGDQIYIPVSVLAKAFMEDEDVRELFIKVAHVSYDLAENHNASGFMYYPGSFGYWETVGKTESFFYRIDGSWVTDDSLKVDEETAAAIKRLRELFPGYKDQYQLNIRMGSTSTEGRLFVEFTILLRHKNFVGKVRHAEDQYMEFLIYTPYDLSDLEIYGYKKIDENWYSRFMGMV